MMPFPCRYGRCLTGLALLFTLFLTIGLMPSPGSDRLVPPAAAAEGGTLIGLITNVQTGERVADVLVSAAGQQLRTGPTGVYIFENLPSGSHLVLAEHPAFQPASRRGLVVASQIRWNSLALTPRSQPPPAPTATPAPHSGTLIGLVTEAESGQRLAGVTVTVAGQRLVTDERGLYRFENVPVGPQLVQAEKAGFVAGQKSRLVVANAVRWNSLELRPRLAGCPASSSARFELVPIAQLPAEPRPDHLHGDLNLAQRGFSPTQASLTLQNYVGGVDPLAPQLDTLLAPARFPGIRTVYRVNQWHWDCGRHGCPGSALTSWPVTMIGLPVESGQPLAIPDRTPQIYGGGFKALVLYAAERRLTLGYTRDDTVASGYTVHLENVCVDPNLVALYRAQQDSAGYRVSGYLPALRSNEPFGLTLGNELQVAIRDRGTFMDPRSRKDWWQGY